MLIIALAGSTYADSTIHLDGTWAFQLDPNNQGIKEQWWTQQLPDTIKLPGYLQAQGFGEKPGPETKFVLSGMLKLGASLSPDPVYDKFRTKENYKSSEILQPLRHYIGPAWYSREITIPENWNGQHLTMTLERCHWESRVWVDGSPAGSADGIGVPHHYDLTKLLTPGKHRITIRVTNEMVVSIGASAHSISDQTQTTWNGILGKMAISATDPIWLDDVQIFPNLAKNEAMVRVTIGNLTGQAGKAKFTLDAKGYNAENKHDPQPTHHTVAFEKEARTTIELHYPMGKGTRLWDEFDPALYHLQVDLSAGKNHHSRTTRFGMREFGIDGKHFTINGHQIFLRGNADCAVFPFTGHPPMDVASWRKIWQTHKDFGLNHSRFHSWCPPQAAFTAADELGIYLAPEASEWATVASKIQEAFFARESAAILREYGNSPCFVMMALGNERGGKKEILTRLVDGWKNSDRRRRYSAKSNSHANPPAIEYEVVGKIASHRIRYQMGWPPRPAASWFLVKPPQTMIDWRVPISKVSKPIIAHETAQICSYPDVEGGIAKFTGFLRPTYLEIARDQLTERGMLDQVPDFIKASGLWQIELTKEEMEGHLRTPGLAGFHWLALNDFPGQGTAPVGFTDFAWDPKSYVDAKKVRQFIAPTVILARLDKRVWSSAEPFHAKIELSHWGQKPIQISDLQASIIDADGKEVFRQSLPAKTFALANAQAIGSIEVPAKQLKKSPAKYTLRVESATHRLKNHWDFWVFPEKLNVEKPGKVVVTNNFDAKTRKLLASGAKVLLLPRRETLKGELPLCFLNHYWTSFNRYGGDSSSTGMLIDPTHPVFSEFPTDPHVNWQWWDLLTQTRPMILDQWDTPDAWPKSYRPLIQPVDTWKLNRKLAALAEAKVGKGKLMICTMDIESDLENRPVARQFRHSLLRYMKSDQFTPQAMITEKMVQSIYMSADVDSFISRLDAEITASSAHPEYPASMAIDGNKNTMWHTNWKKQPGDKHPHHLTIHLPKPSTIKGLSYRPRIKKDLGNIAKFAIYTSTDGKTWGKPIARGDWKPGKGKREINFAPISTQWLKLEILSEIHGKPHASAAEIDLIPADALPSEG